MIEREQRASERRRTTIPLYHPERRDGFDRRRRSPVLETLRSNDAAVLFVLVALNLLSLADWLLTVVALRSGAVEGNIVLASLMERSIALAGLFKLAVTLLVSLLMWRWRAKRLVLVTIVGAVGVYVAVVAYHLNGLAVIGVL